MNFSSQSQSHSSANSRYMKKLADFLGKEIPNYSHCQWNRTYFQSLTFSLNSHHGSFLVTPVKLVQLCSGAPEGGQNPLSQKRVDIRKLLSDTRAGAMHKNHNQIFSMELIQHFSLILNATLPSLKPSIHIKIRWSGPCENAWMP